MAVGRPIKLTPNVASKTVSIVATAGQTTFTPTGGYRIGDLAVYRNGVRLVAGRDFTAVDGANVILQQGATVDDVLEFQIFDNFNIADAVPASDLILLSLPTPMDENNIPDYSALTNVASQLSDILSPNSFLTSNKIFSLLVLKV